MLFSYIISYVSTHTSKISVRASGLMSLKLPESKSDWQLFAPKKVCGKRYIRKSFKIFRVINQAGIPVNDKGKNHRQNFSRYT